jgi:uncharacterized membrane protein
MRNEISKYRQHDPRINYRGVNASRIENLTDAVFGIAITLLIFNIANPNSFEDLMSFVKTLPAFLLSISFLLLIWNEHFRFSEVYTLNDTILVMLNTFFIALVIFFVYPLRFLALLFTNFLFQTNVGISIQNEQMHFLMIFYGSAIFALYFVLFLFYVRVSKIKGILELNDFEEFHTKWHKKRLMILFLVPLLSVGLTVGLSNYSTALAAFMGGMTYWLFWPASLLWERKFKKKSENFRFSE